MGGYSDPQGEGSVKDSTFATAVIILFWLVALIVAWAIEFL